MRIALSVTLLCGVLSIAAPSAAQDAPAPPETPSAQAEEHEADVDAALAAAIAEARVGNLSEQRDAGFVLLGYGSVSILGGAVLAIAGRDDPLLLWTGLISASWGLVNGLLSISSFDLGGATARSIEAGRALRGDALEALRDEQVSQARAQAQIFALNAGLDVGYMVAGILVAVLAQQGASKDPVWTGFGLAMATQGVGLFGFDVAELIQSNDRASRLIVAR